MTEGAESVPVGFEISASVFPSAVGAPAVGLEGG